jgi:hypothetical protein
MYLWTSAEETDQIGDSARVAANTLEAQVNKCLTEVEVGEWKKWRVIFVRLPNHMRERYRETRRLTRRDMALDFHVAIDYQAAIDADFNGHIDLMLEALEKTISYFKKAGISKESQDRILQCLRISAEQVKAERSSKH